MLAQLSGARPWGACQHVLRAVVQLVLIRDSLAPTRTLQLVRGLFNHAQALAGASYAFAFGLLAALLELTIYFPTVNALCTAPQNHEMWLWSEEFLINARGLADTEERNFQQRVIVAAATGTADTAAQIVRDPSNIVPQPIAWLTAAGAGQDDMRESLTTPQRTANMVLFMLQKHMIACGLEVKSLKEDPPVPPPAAAEAGVPVPGAAPEA